MDKGVAVTAVGMRVMTTREQMFRSEQWGVEEESLGNDGRYPGQWLPSHRFCPDPASDLAWA